MEFLKFIDGTNMVQIVKILIHRNKIKNKLIKYRIKISSRNKK